MHTSWREGGERSRQRDQAAQRLRGERGQLSFQKPEKGRGSERLDRVDSTWGGEDEAGENRGQGGPLKTSCVYA